MVADDHQGIGQSNALIANVPFSNIINSTNHLIGKQVGAVVHVALPDEEPTVGRLVARYLDLNDNTVFHQVLVELAARDGWRVIEPRLELIEDQSLVAWQQ